MAGDRHPQAAETDQQPTQGHAHQEQQDDDIERGLREAMHGRPHSRGYDRCAEDAQPCLRQRRENLPAKSQLFCNGRTDDETTGNQKVEWIVA